MKRLVAPRVVPSGVAVARWDALIATLASIAAVLLSATAAHSLHSVRFAPLDALPEQTQVLRRAAFQDQQPSPDARRVADWVAESNDNGQAAFAVLDKRNARLYVFDRDAALVGSSLVLLGAATGDDTAPGIGNKLLSQLAAAERTTPAGRFVSEPGHDSAGDDVIWVDYDAAIAMHRVHEYAPGERRFERIATPSADDKRISNGCINVPATFYDAVVKARLGAAYAVVYVLPEVKPLREAFPALH